MAMRSIKLTGGKEYWYCLCGNVEVEETKHPVQAEDATLADNVNHPSHYASGGVECIDAMTQCFGTEATQDFCLLNAFKYLWRCKSKHQTPEEDIKKARWYLDEWISLQKIEET